MIAGKINGSYSLYQYSLAADKDRFFNADFVPNSGANGCVFGDFMHNIDEK